MNNKIKGIEPAVPEKELRKRERLLTAKWTCVHIILPILGGILTLNLVVYGAVLAFNQ